jgi:large subunit ribosomal protein L19
MKLNRFVEIAERSNIKFQPLPHLGVGDIVKVGIQIREGNKERVQTYQGTIIGCNSKGLIDKIIVRKIFQGIGIERTILLRSPRTASIEIINRGKVRRAKLYYLRQRSGKSSRILTRPTATIPKGSQI